MKRTVISMQMLWIVSIIDFPTFNNVYIDETIISSCLGATKNGASVLSIGLILTQLMLFKAFTAEGFTKCRGNNVDSDRLGSKTWFHCLLSLCLGYLVYFFELQFPFKKTGIIMNTQQGFREY